MRKKQILPPPRQQKLSFAKDDVWPKLPDAARQMCQEQIVRLLTTALTEEREPRRNDDERQDSI